MINDLEKVLESEADIIGSYGTKYFMFSEDEIKSFIKLLEKSLKEEEKC